MRSYYEARTDGKPDIVAANFAVAPLCILAPTSCILLECGRAKTKYSPSRMKSGLLVCACLSVCCTGSTSEDYRNAAKNEATTFNPYLEVLRKHPYESEQGYVQVRRGAFLFWWLYFADGTRKGAADKPLVIWIQGGPGLAATGLAHFAELGPFTMQMEPRNHTWVKGRNVLLIDHPVGTGFSYTVNDDTNLYATKDRRVALDLFQAIKGFLTVHPEFESGSTYITSQSYGGKIAPRLGYILHKAIQKRKIKMNLKAVGIGSGWVDPREISLVLPSFMYHMGLIDIKSYHKTKAMTIKMATLISRMSLKEAAAMDSTVFREYLNNNEIESFLNVIKPDVYVDLRKLADDVNKYVKPTLPMVNQSRIWSYESDKVFDKLSENMMLSSMRYVEKLLNQSHIKVVVYNGNMDATCPMAGAVNWVHKLRWSRAQEFRNKERSEMSGHMAGFYKAVGRLSLWWVLGAGHWVPEDNPVAMEEILEYMTTNDT